MFNSDVTSMTIDKNDVGQIALGLQRRDALFIQTLVEQFQYRLVRYLIYLLGSRDGVDDLVQETWLRVLERGHTFDGKSRFEPWLFSIARHLAIDQMRQLRHVSIDENTDGDWNPESPVSDAVSPFVLAARSQDAELLAGSMQALGPIYREALVLRFQEELSLQEISAIVGAPVPTVASRIKRGIATLRVQFEGRRP
jgi:RNA polymerase sigma-70 factor (ECF subfamily)